MNRQFRPAGGAKAPHPPVPSNGHEPPDGPPAAEAWCAALREAAPDAVLSIDAEGRIVEANAPSERVFGCPPAELLGRRFEALVPERARPLLSPLGAGSAVRVELPIVRPDGAEVAVELSAVPVRLAGPGLFVVFVRDVSERKRADEVLRQTQRFLEEGQAIAHVGSWVSGVLDPDTIWWSPETYRIFGVPEDERITVERFFSLLHPGDRDAVRAASTAAMRDAAPYDVVHRVICPDGSLRIVRERAVVVRDENGTPVRMVGTAQDVTERTRREHRDRMLAATSVELGRVFEYPGVIETAVRLAVPVIGESAMIEIDDDRGLHRTAAGEPLPEGGTFLRVPLHARGHDFGTLVIVRGDEGPAFDAFDRDMAAEFASRAAFAIDNARLFHEAQESIRARDEFLAIAGHELKTPIAPLRMQLQSLLRSIEAGRAPGEPKLRERLDSLDRGVGRLEALVETLLQVSDLTVGPVVLSRSDEDLAEVVRAAVERQRPQIERQAGAFVLDARPAPGFFDAALVGRACEGLIANALKYGAGKPIELTVRADSGALRFSVMDQGGGIPLEEQQRIFERFTRRGPLEHFGGFGLGLWIAKQIAEAHGGAIELWSRPGHGARFTLRLPAARPGGEADG